MIRFEQFSFAYEDMAAPQLKDFDFTIQKGECVLFCGASACGKTTAAKCINGLIPHFTQGQMEGGVWVKDKKTADTPSWLLAQTVGSVFQNPKTQFFNLDSNSELVFGMENLGVPRTQMHTRVRQMTQALDIGGLLNRDVFALSGGEKQILALASIYAVNPDIYVLDEPTANIDADGMMRLHRILEKLKAMGKTIVISEHRLYFLMDLIDKAVWIERGRVKDIFTGQQFRAISDARRAKMGLRCFCTPQQPARAPSARTQGLLQVEGLSVQSGKKRLINGVSFCADAGDIIAVTGGNGSGKTTLLRVLCGLMRESAGSITYQQKRYPCKKRRDLCAMTMQDVAHQLFADSVEGEFALLNCNVTKEEISSMLDTLGLDAYRDRHPMTLSGGQKQRLALAAAIVSGKPVMIFDEPTSGLDYGNLCKVCALIRSIAKEKIVFIATHDRELVNMLCTRELVISQQKAVMFDFTDR